MLKQMAAGLLTWFALDYLWFGLLMNGFYKTQMGSLARKSGDAFAPIWTPALLLYVLVVFGIAVFVLPRAAGGTIWQVAGWGALFGLIGFGVYDLTNYATINNWPLALTVVDMAWGAFVCATVASVMFTVGRQ